MIDPIQNQVAVAHLDNDPPLHEREGSAFPLIVWPDLQKRACFTNGFAVIVITAKVLVL